jgi:hypothetical protein
MVVAVVAKLLVTLPTRLETLLSWLEMEAEMELATEEAWLPESPEVAEATMPETSLVMEPTMEVTSPTMEDAAPLGRTPVASERIPPPMLVRSEMIPPCAYSQMYD